MSRGSCPRCLAPLRKVAAFCGTCGLAVGAAVELDDLADEAIAGGDEVVLRAPGGGRRTVAIGALVGLLVATVVVVATSGSGGGRAASVTINATTSSPAGHDSSGPDSSSPDSSDPETPSPVAIRPVVPTTEPAAATTTGSRVVPAPVTAGTGQPLLGEPSGLALVLVSPDGQLHHLALDTGRLDATAFVDVPPNGPPTWFLSEQGLVYSSGTELRVRATDGTERAIAGLSVGPNELMAPGPGSEIWAMSANLEDIVLVRIDLRTASVVEQKTLQNAYLVGSDEAGRPLLQLRDGALWRLETSGAWTVVGGITTLPLGHDRYLETICSSPPACSLAVHSADRHVLIALPSPPGGEGRAVVAAASNGTLTALVRTPTTGDPTVEIYDANGTRIAVLTDYVAQNRLFRNAGHLWWSPDGRWVFWLGANGVHAWRQGLTDPVTIEIASDTIAIADILVTRAD